ncbi:MAG: MBL fold metallo-hydrolase [Deltaproteobacteria bacterium]|nr:MBL fold metallo-hydrolase [Candidatus Anaeroferrophillacea bacterium]
MESGLSFALTHLGGEQTVTGSCHLLRVNGVNILVDCGLAQGGERVAPMASWPVPPDKIDFLFLTHAHIDHIGRLPELISGGFRGEIITTEATAFLLAPLLEDALRLNWGQSKNISRNNFTLTPIKQLLAEVERLTWSFEYGREFDLKNGIRFQLGRAGHILGSAWVRLALGGESVVFSGDLGAPETPLLPAPDIPAPCDLLVMESTYGDRLHGDRRERVARLGAILQHALADGGRVFIPAFALGRSQELIYEIDRLYTEKAWRAEFSGLAGARVPVFLDTPLGLKITEVYGRLKPFWDQESKELLAGGDNPLDFDILYGVDSAREHHLLLDYQGPAIVLAGSGMCSGGRIVDHLKNGIGEARNDILFVGYQAAGTPGRDILTYHRRPGAYVYLDDRRCDIRARVHQLTGYSAHADQAGLLAWVAAMEQPPGRIKLVHGEPPAQAALAEKLRVSTGSEV